MSTEMNTWQMNVHKKSELLKRSYTKCLFIFLRSKLFPILWLILTCDRNERCDGRTGGRADRRTAAGWGLLIKVYMSDMQTCPMIRSKSRSFKSNGNDTNNNTLTYKLHLMFLKYFDVYVRFTFIYYLTY